LTTEWKARPLSEVLQKTETVNPALSPDTEFDYIDVSSVSNTTFQIEGTQRLNGKDAPSRARRLVKANDVIFATVRPTLKRIAVVPDLLDNQVCSTGYVVLRPNGLIESRFVFYWLFTDDFMGRMHSLQKGASYPAVTDREVRSQLIPVPPLAEQRRIVGILDEAFAAIAAVRANTEQNVRNAGELFESRLNGVFARVGDGSADTRLGDVCGISSRLVDPRLDEYADLKHVGGGNIESNTGNLLHLESARDEALKSGKFLFDETMVLYSKIRPYLRKVARPSFRGVCSADVYPLSPAAGKMNRDYLFYLLLSPAFTAYAMAGSARAGMPKVNRGHLFAFRTRLPSADEQTEVAASLDALAGQVARLGSTLREKSVALDGLKQSLIHQAFAGAL
jgi:type I restriction enzyme S subunit